MDKVKYVNHLGETLDLRSGGIVSSYWAVKNFVDSVNNSRLTSEGKTVPLTLVCLSKNDANRLIDTLEKDSVQNVFGRFYINDWYIRVLYQGVEIVMEHGEKIKLIVSFYAEETVFIKETEYELSSEAEQEQEYLDFPFGFPFSFGADKLTAAAVKNNELLDADFVLRISTPVTGVNFSIDANSYIVDSAINSGEVFVLDTSEKVVYKDTTSGKVNLLGKADDTSYIFKKISQGTHKVTWSGDFVLYIKILERRRTPKWT
jgi:hypothetical protein